MQPRHRQPDLAERRIVLGQRIDIAAPLGSQSLGAVTAVFNAVGENPAVKTGDGAHGVGVVGVDDDRAALRRMRGEFRKRADDLLNAGIVVEMVGLDVEDDGRLRVQVEKRATVFARLGDEPFILPERIRPADLRQRRA